MSDPIRITPEDLRDPRIDEVIARQRSFGIAAPPGEEKPTPLYMRPWFALMVAGALASLLSWCITEPVMDDGLRFRGRIESIAATGDGHDETAELPAVAVVAGHRVFLSRRLVVLDEKHARLALSDLHEGDAVEVLAEDAPLADGSIVLFSAFVRRIDPVTIDAAPVDLGRLQRRDTLLGVLIFPIMAGLIGMLIGATDGVLSRAWSRAVFTSTVGLGVGCLGGLIASFLAGILYAFGEHFVWQVHGDQAGPLSGTSLLVQIMTRGVAWTTIGVVAGLGQGLAMRSKKLLLNGLIGGTIGGLLGGILFDPINLALADVYVTGGAEASRLVGYVVIGATIGLMIGLVEFATRDAWVRLLTGPIAGKEFVLYRNPTWIGSSPKCEIYLFKDEQVAPRHACIRRSAETWEIEDQGTSTGTFLSGRQVGRTRLRDRDRLRIGRTAIEFRLRDE